MRDKGSISLNSLFEMKKILTLLRLLFQFWIADAIFLLYLLNVIAQNETCVVLNYFLLSNTITVMMQFIKSWHSLCIITVWSFTFCSGLDKFRTFLLDIEGTTNQLVTTTTQLATATALNVELNQKVEKMNLTIAKLLKAYEKLQNEVDKQKGRQVSSPLRASNLL